MANYRKQIVEELEDIPDEALFKIYEFIHFVKIKLKKAKKEEGNNLSYTKDPLDDVIGCCIGPNDLSDKHNFYLYGGDE